ncbi:cell division protein ZapD [Comamonas sp. NoAH]|uniref:cell division protein ZapD n=1 Tax=Comamonas halotolerans TaxID=3041496 RepID=UPI0024E05996|nr:cell division protein ZapD [Comamonas sp. NoAH]
MILYEYPFNERLRTYLRLEQLFRRLFELVTRESPVDHHFALATIFEIMDVAARADLKLDLLRDLDRHKSLFEGLRDNPAIAQDMLDDIIAQLDHCYTALHAQTGKTGQPLTEIDWLMAIRSRIGIPGGTSSFDLPAYHRWQSKPAHERQDDLQQWTQCLRPLSDSLVLLLGLLRETGTPQKVAATNGQFMQSLPAGKAYQLLRLRIDSDSGLIPEISANRLMVSVRLVRPNESGSLQSTTENAVFELTLCA